MPGMDGATAYVNAYNAKVQGAPSQNQRDAWAYLGDIFKQFGLPDSLMAWAKKELEIGASPSQVLLDLYDRPEFNKRFPGIAARRAAGLSPITPQDYIHYEQTAHELFRAAGMPPGFGSRAYVDDLIAKDVSPQELDDRIKKGYQRVTNADPAVRTAFKQYFGINGDQALAAYFLDPDRAAPLLEEQARAASVAGLGHGMLGGWLDKDRATLLAQNGFDADRARSGFQHLAQIAPLFTETISDTLDISVDNQGLASEFGIAGAGSPAGSGAPNVPPPGGGAAGPGQIGGDEAFQSGSRGGGPQVPDWLGRGTTGPASANQPAVKPLTAAESMAQIEQRRQTRANAFKGGGGAGDDKDGLTGLGSDR